MHPNLVKFVKENKRKIPVDDINTAGFGIV